MTYLHHLTTFTNYFFADRERDTMQFSVHLLIVFKNWFRTSCADSISTMEVIKNTRVRAHACKLSSHWRRQETNSHSQILDNRHKQLPKNSSHKYTNATTFSNAAIRFIRPADETMRTANPVRYFANRTWHACDVTSNQRPSSHLSSRITGSPVRSSQFANYQTPQYVLQWLRCESARW